MKSFRKPNNKKVEVKIGLDEEYKLRVCSQSYLGKRGYTIPKSVLNTADLEFLKKDLFLKPEVFGANYGNKTEGQNEFPVYRENDKNKYYC